MYRDYSYWQPRPTTNDFKLDIVSNHPDFNGRALKKYSLDGINSVGVFGNEPFEVHFTNNSYEDVQARISLDGTDVLTGKAADLEINHDMWLVKAGRTLHLKAWHENSQGGARFVFTNAENGVSLNTHGDVSHKGIISVAVFTESERPARQLVNSKRRQGYFQSRDPGNITKGGSISYNISDAVPYAAAGGASMDSLNLDYSREISEQEPRTESIKKTSAAVGAGEYVEQRTHTVQGLNKPVLNSIIRVRYMWWDEVVQALKNSSRYEDPHPTGFPAEKIRTFADLSSVPRVKSVGAESIYTRVEPARTSSPNVRETSTSFDRFV